MQTDDDILGGTIITDKYSSPNIACRVPIIRLSDYWKEHINDRVHVLKLNVEGAEYDIFEDLLDGGIINEFDTIIYEDHGWRCGGTRVIPSVIEQGKKVFKRLRSEFKGKILFMNGGKWDLVTERPSHLT